MAWEWLTDVVDDVWDWGVDVADDVVDWWDTTDIATDAYDLADTSDYWSSDVGFNNLGGLFSGVDTGDLLGLGQTAYGAYQQADLADTMAQSYQPLLNLQAQSQAAMAPYMNPTQRAALQAQEEERITGLMTPFVDRAAYRGRAADLSQGVGDSSIADWRDQERQRAAAELISDYVVPTAAQNVQSAGTGLSNLYTAQGGLLTGQPAMIQAQAEQQQAADPWSNIFLNI